MIAKKLLRLSSVVNNILQLGSLPVSLASVPTRVIGSSSGSRYFSSKTKGDNSIEKVELGEEKGSREGLPNEAVFYHPQHDMYICWHPEVPFPYEMSKPIPVEVAGTESSLKIQALEPVREVFRKKDQRLIRRELMQLTYTAQYKWRGIHGRKIKWVRKDMDPLKQQRDREYL